MNTDITLATELELTDGELETIVGGNSLSFGSISILSSYSPRYNYGGHNTVNQNWSNTGDTNNFGAFTTHGNSTGFVSNAGGNSYSGDTNGNVSYPFFGL